MTRYVKECRQDSLYNFFDKHKKIMDATAVTFAISYVHVDKTIHIFHYFINNIYSLFIVCNQESGRV